MFVGIVAVGTSVGIFEGIKLGMSVEVGSGVTSMVGNAIPGCRVVGIGVGIVKLDVGSKVFITFFVFCVCTRVMVDSICQFFKVKTQTKKKKQKQKQKQKISTKLVGVGVGSSVGLTVPNVALQTQMSGTNILPSFAQ